MQIADAECRPALRDTDHLLSFTWETMYRGAYSSLMIRVLETELRSHIDIPSEECLICRKFPKAGTRCKKGQFQRNTKIFCTKLYFL